MTIENKGDNENPPKTELASLCEFMAANFTHSCLENGVLPNDKVFKRLYILFDTEGYYVGFFARKYFCDGDYRLIGGTESFFYNAVLLYPRKSFSASDLAHSLEKELLKVGKKPEYKKLIDALLLPTDEFTGVSYE